MKTVFSNRRCRLYRSHAVVELLDQGYHVIVIDSLENGFLDVMNSAVNSTRNLRTLPFLESKYFRKIQLTVSCIRCLY